MDVAERKLPGVVDRLHRGEPVDLDAETQPIDVAAAGEIGRVAAAFTAVQRVAVSVAVDQVALRRSVSEMFVNMARRSQSLVVLSGSEPGHAGASRSRWPRCCAPRSQRSRTTRACACCRWARSRWRATRAWTLPTCWPS